MNLFYQEYGEGPPLLILHGLLGASGNWHTLSRNVFAQHFHVYAVDLRNHGRSPHDEVFDYPHMVEDIVRFLEVHQLEQVMLLGHSMGGKVAMWMALEHPDRVSRLIVADIAPKAYPPHHKKLLDALLDLNPRAYSSRADIDKKLAEQIEEPGVRQFLMKNLKSEGAGSYSWKMNLNAIYENYSKINVGLPHQTSFSRPTLFIRGVKSHYIQDDDLVAIRRLFPDALLADLPSAGHWVHAEAPKPFSELVVEFLT